MKTETNTTLSNEVEETAAAPVSAQWERPNFEKPQPKADRPRLRIGGTLESAPKEKSGRGRVESTFKLREESVAETESPEVILAKRQNFKSIFVAGATR